ncbi:LacI family transcriptional regulator [Lachnotalea glycerini]|uniref:LacI family transcriptional regulator n=1 Tax=Lachnotalea glycerini TaxID=1763509 RepID=A0A318ES53_9FIRM|nr:LacI family DNA-binding transcriptional regulator [Lachnotalea glycerini]PXV90184.1 LacI family transcriptional regulator [Lachnotalea glycerini]
MAKTVKLSDIAQKARVSTVTVSKALAGQKGVSLKMREEIKRIADEMGYVKSHGVSKEQNRKSYTFGIIVAERYLEKNQSFYWQLYQDVSQNAIHKNGFTILEVITYEDEKGSFVPKIVSEQRVDAIIIMGAFKTDYAIFLKNNIKIPLIFMDTMDPSENGESVVTDNMMGAYCMTNHLFEMGHSKIGFVGTRLATTSIDNRFFGYLKSLMEHGIESRKDWIIDDRDKEIGRCDLDKYFQLPMEMPTAFLCNCDLTASLLIRKLMKEGYQVPDDISVAGFDNFLCTQLIDIGITTYAINIKEMANKTVDLLILKLENPQYYAGVSMIAGHFIKRESVKLLGTSIPFI